MKPVQAIIVLGRGIGLDGTLPANALRRVERAVLLYKKQRTPLIFSGRWTYRYIDPVPPRTEALAMAEYAQSLGVDASDCLLEDTSMDTIGNAIFTKKLYLVPRDWVTLQVITSVDHLERTKYIFRKVLGPNYSLAFDPCSIGDDQDLIARATAREKRSLALTKELLDPIEDGNDEQLDYLVENVLVAYAKNPQISRDKLKELLGD